MGALEDYKQQYFSYNNKAALYDWSMLFTFATSMGGIGYAASSIFTGLNSTHFLGLIIGVLGIGGSEYCFRKEKKYSSLASKVYFDNEEKWLEEE